MSKKLLILGGTQMVGRDFIEFCLENKYDYEIYISNRGLTNPSLFNGLKHIKIDRDIDDGCSNLEKYNYDIVVDFSCYNTSQLCNALKHIDTTNYFLLSTLTVLDSLALSDSKNFLHKYATNKKLLEEYILSNNLPITIVRTGAMYGKNDYTNRYYESNNKFYTKLDNKEIKESKYTINVRTFSGYLCKYVQNSGSQAHTIVEINKDGIIEQSSGG